MLHVLHITPTFWPATHWGGPIYSAKALCDGLDARGDVAIRVLTTDSAGSGGRVPARATDEDAYPVIRSRRIAGASVAPGLAARLPGEIGRADVVHVSATYSFPTLPALLAASARRRPVVWSPRGALQATAEWADAPRRTAKIAFERLAQILRPEMTVLHVTSEEEAARSVANLPGIEAVVIPNSVELPPEPGHRAWRPDGRLRLLFLSRLHPKKGLDLLLDAMERLPDHVSLDVYGDGDEPHASRLRARAGTMPRVRLHGAIDGAAKTAAFAAADLFVLPSWSENFGNVVAEALAHGVPVLTTDRTPWRKLQSHGCGAVIDPGSDDLAQAILAHGDRDLAAMGRRGRAWMALDFSPGATSGAFADLYHRLSRPVGATGR